MVSVFTAIDRDGVARNKQAAIPGLLEPGGTVGYLRRDQPDCVMITVPAQVFNG